MLWRDKRRRGQRAPVLISNGFGPVPWFRFPTRQCRNIYRRQRRAVRKVPWSLDSMVDVTNYAEAVRRAAIDVLAETGHEKISLIGWSMGGVANLYAVKRLGLHCLVDNFVTFGSPFGGADLTYPGIFTGLWTKTAMQLMPGSQFLQELNRDDLPGEINYVAVCGTHDLICPPSQSRLDGAQNIEGPFGHGDFLMCVQLHTLLASKLE